MISKGWRVITLMPIWNLAPSFESIVRIISCLLLRETKQRFYALGSHGQAAFACVPPREKWWGHQLPGSGDTGLVAASYDCQNLLSEVKIVIKVPSMGRRFWAYFPFDWARKGLILKLKDRQHSIRVNFLIKGHLHIKKCTQSSRPVLTRKELLFRKTNPSTMSPIL